MPDRIQDLPNLGRFIAERLEAVDISDVDDLRAVGAVEAYARLKFRYGREITLNALWALDAALSDIDWRALTPERKQALRDGLASRNRRG